MSIKIKLQTAITPVLTVYDNGEKGESSGIGKWLLDFLKPVIKVETNDHSLYKTGDFYEDQSVYYLGGFVLVLIILIWIVRKI